MSPQLRFSATVSVLTMALFAMSMGLTGPHGEVGDVPSLDAPSHLSVSFTE